MYKPVKPVANIIIGAGPAGVQLGYFFQKAGLDYVILERNEFAGSFFDRYPLSGQLISINKRFTGVDDADFNLRHDWNSLLSDDGPKFTEYSKEYYPDSKDLVRYINDFAAKYKLNIKYKTNVDRISKIGENGYAIAVTDSTGKWLYRCNALIVATGLGLPSRDGICDESVVKVKHYAEYEKEIQKQDQDGKLDAEFRAQISSYDNYEIALGSIPRLARLEDLHQIFPKEKFFLCGSGKKLIKILK
jgi:flavin-dependent dehydrogenase